MRRMANERAGSNPYLDSVFAALGAWQVDLMVLSGTVETRPLGNFNQVLGVSCPVNFSHRRVELQGFVFHGESSGMG
jgi:hypothetical protein